MNEPKVESEATQKPVVPQEMSVGQTPIVHNISPRVLSGSLLASNQNAIHWSRNGLIAFASHNRVFVADVRPNARLCQSLHRHQGAVNHVKWINSNALILASGDIHGNIMIWDVVEANVLTFIPATKDTKTIQSLEWIEMTNSKSSEQTYLLVSYSSNHLILYDTELGSVVWNKHFTNSLGKLSLDPFCTSNALIAFNGNETSFAIINDLNANKSPNDCFKEFLIVYKKSSANPTNSPKTVSNLFKYELKVKGINENSDDDDNYYDAFNEYLQICYHHSVRYQVFITFYREIFLIDLSLESIICWIPIERNCSNLVQVYSCHQRNAFLTFHESGSVSLRLYQKTLVPDSLIGTNVLNINYSSLCQSDALRLTKQNKIYGFTVSPMDETKVALLLSNGKLLVKSIRKSNYINKSPCAPFLSDLISIEEYKAGTDIKRGKNYRILVTQLLPAVSTGPHAIRMCPPVTVRNWPLYKPLLAVGDSTGLLQVWNLSTSKLEREFSIHSFPVRGIEWSSLETFLSFAYPNIPPNCSKTNNELNITNITSGRTYSLKSDRSADSSPIEMLKVSHLKQYFIISFKDEPFEIWDLKNLVLLRIMPKQFSAITAIEWSPLYNKRAESLSEIKGDAETHPCGTTLSSKENFVATNSTGELYHFSIEGNVVKEISCIPPESSSDGNITCVTWKSDQVLLGDATGNLNVWDLKKKVSKTESTHRGSIKKIRFGPGRGNMKFLVLYSDGVDVWDIKDLKLTSQLKSPRDISCKIIDIDWAGSDRPILSTSEGTILITDLTLKNYTSSLSDLAVDVIDDENVNYNNINFHYLPSMSQFIFKSKLLLNQLENCPKLPECEIERNIIVSKLFNDEYAFHFWNIVSSVVYNKKELDSIYDICLDNEAFKQITHEKIALLESVRNSNRHNKTCFEWYIILKEYQRAVQILLEADPNPKNDDFLIDALKACLVASLQSNNTEAHPVIKLVATNLIANGRVEEGAQLLCLIGKTHDACRYFQGANKWLDAVWLAKCTLEGNEYNGIIGRWCDYLITQNNIKTAVFVLLTIKQFLKVIQILYKHDVEKAIFLAIVCIKHDLITIDESPIINEVFSGYCNMLQEAGLDQTALDHYKQFFIKSL